MNGRTQMNPRKTLKENEAQEIIQVSIIPKLRGGRHASKVTSYAISEEAKEVSKVSKASKVMSNQKFTQEELDLC